MTITTQTADTPIAGAHPLDEEARRRRIAAAIEELRPLLQNDGGDMELVSVSGDVVRVALKGACTSCGLAVQTLGAIRRRLMERMGEPTIRVLPGTIS